MLDGGDGAQDGQAVDARFDVGGCAVLVGQHFGHSGHLITGWDDQGDHRSAIASGGLQGFDQFFDLPNLDILV